jgi:hypothetical protein
MISTPNGTSYAELNAVLEQVQRTSATWTPVTDHQLLALQARWAAALSARLDQAIETAGPSVEAATSVWHELAREQHPLRAMLDAHEAHSPALADARRGEFHMMALAAGIASLNTPAAQAERAGYELALRIGASRCQGVGAVREFDHPVLHT